jgi:hypothetical protein
MRKIRSFAVALIFLMLSAASVQAHIDTKSANSPTGQLSPGTEYSVDYFGYIYCAIVGPTPEASAEYYDGQVLSLTIANAVAEVNDYKWLNASVTDATVLLENCSEEGSDIGTPGPKIVLKQTINFTVSETAPAFTTFTFQPGAIGESNQGGNFSAEIGYVPSFTAPTALSFDVASGGATATIPLTMAANANSVFNFDVTSFTIDDAPATGGAMAHIQETLELETGIFSEAGTAISSVDLHFGAGDGKMDHGDADMDHSDMDHSDMDHSDTDMGTVPTWNTSQVTIDITLAALQDATQVSAPTTVILTFTNVDLGSTPADGQVDEETDDTSFIPGFEVAAAVGALGAVAALRRRQV